MVGPEQLMLSSCSASQNGPHPALHSLDGGSGIQMRRFRQSGRHAGELANRMRDIVVVVRPRRARCSMAPFWKVRPPILPQRHGLPFVEAH
jgi:hypothetical protein